MEKCWIVKKYINKKVFKLSETFLLKYMYACMYMMYNNMYLKYNIYIYERNMYTYILSYSFISL